ncbi:MAG: DUF2807 domain-containing protein [Aphanocapsa sp. GSE-SYN-MK-11-07L]|jgi:hypothetical protein|nr:DUF2807 domain-containing protein [Aphanocapsa sp. GSE-SYN-MK-11-07L]
MNDLTKYKGNFINFAEREFEFNNPTAKRFESANFLDVHVSCPVGIFPSGSSLILIEIDSEDPDDFLINYEQGGIIIKEKPQSSRVAGNNVVNIGSIAGNVTIANGRIFVNGREFTSDNQGVSRRQSRIKMHAPSGIDLNANLNGVCVLASKVAFNLASVKVAGQSSVGLAAKKLKLKLAGQGENFIVMMGGSLEADISGQGNARIKGQWSSADVSVSGMGTISTEGICNGDYDASVSGMGSISHNGEIKGRKRQSKTGMGSINI